MARILRNGIGFRSNWLFYDQELLTCERTSPEQLRTILDMGASAINDTLDAVFSDTRNRNPGAEVKYPWLQTIRLCARGEEPQILTADGLTPPYIEISKTVHEEPLDIIEPLRLYWTAGYGSGHIFDVRAISHMDGWDDQHDGMWLQVRPSAKVL